MFVENIVKKIVCNGMVRFPLQNAVNLLQDGDMLEGRLAEQNFPRLNVGIRELGSPRRELDIALLQPGESELASASGLPAAHRSLLCFPDREEHVRRPARS